MNADMPKKLPPYVLTETNRHGNKAYYFRIGKGKRTRLPDPKASDFLASYAEALQSSDKPPKKKANAGTLEWLIRQYRESSAYRGLSEATRKQRDNIFRGVIEKAGTAPFAYVSKASIINGREDRAATPAQARNYLDAMRGLFRWALEADHVKDDPTRDVKNPQRPKTEGFAVWLDSEIAAFRQRWPLGTHERVWLEVLIGTGGRRGDAVLMGKQHVKDGMAAFETAKEGVWAFTPILPEMQDAIDTGPTGDLTFIVGKTGRNLTKETFGNLFRAACNAAGVKKSAHGLRKYAASRYAEMGLSESELESIFGWVRGSAMAAHYSKSAERKLLAKGAAEKIRNKNAPHPKSSAPHLEKSGGKSNA